MYFRIIHRRMVRQLRTPYRLHLHEWINGHIVAPPQESSSGRQLYLAAQECRLQADIRRLTALIQRFERAGNAFTPAQIIDAFLSPTENENLFCVFVRSTVRQLKSLGKERLAETYTTSMNSFMRFRGDKGDIRFDEMNTDMMRMYEAYLKENGLVPNTTSFYMRNLRAIYNRAVEKGLTPDHSPFRHVYTGIGKTMKRAISAKVIRQIKNLDLSFDHRLQQARDLFMFSFYTRGMSFIDMAYLKKKDLKNGILTYRRQKTGQLLSIKWEKPMQDIINRYGDASSPYLLPIITTPDHNRRRQYLNAIRRTNNGLKHIGQKIHTAVKLTSYVARHGWANIAKSQHIPLPVISEAMGHDSESTTRIYLASLNASMVDHANHRIIHAVCSI